MSAAARRALGLGAVWWALAGGSPWFGAAAVAAATATSLVLLPPSGTQMRLAGLARFALHFGAQSLAGGVDVAARALARRPAERTRGIYLAHRTALAPGVPRSLFVGTLGLLPGTVAVEADGADVRIHVLDRSLADPGRVTALEERIAAIFEPAEAPRRGGSS